MVFSKRMLFLLFVLHGGAAFSADPTTADEAVVSEDRNHFVQKFSRGTNVIVVDVRTQPFQRAKHKFKLDESGNMQAVDGRRPLGTDGGSPEALTSEIVSVQVSWNGTHRRVAKRFVADCFNTTAIPARVLVSDDFGAVLITLHGGDGAGAYGVTWTVSQAGSVTRYVAERPSEF